jgi:hypothetical protein
MKRHGQVFVWLLASSSWFKPEPVVVQTSAWHCAEFVLQNLYCY